MCACTGVTRKFTDQFGDQLPWHPDFTVTDGMRSFQQQGRLIKKKHAAHAVTADVSLAETAAAAAFAGADGVIVTGAATGLPTEPEDLKIVGESSDLPVLVGSGVTDANVHRYAAADAVIVGSHFKAEGHWAQPVEAARVERFMDRVRALRQG